MTEVVKNATKRELDDKSDIVVDEKPVVVKVQTEEEKLVEKLALIEKMKKHVEGLVRYEEGLVRCVDGVEKQDEGRFVCETIDEDDDWVILQSQEGINFRVPLKVAQMSVTMKSLIEDAGIEDPIPLPNVDVQALFLVLQYCMYHSKNPDVNKKMLEEKKEDTIEIAPWDKGFTSGVDLLTLFKIVLASNYLDIPCLLNMLAKTIALMLQGKTPDEIKKLFGVTANFTEEEMEEIRKENAWCEEK